MKKVMETQDSDSVELAKVSIVKRIRPPKSTKLKKQRERGYKIKDLE